MDRNSPSSAQPERTGPGVAALLRQRKDTILRSWQKRVVSEVRPVELAGLALRNDVPLLIDALADWLGSEEAPETSLAAAIALVHVTQRLDAGLALSQLLREYRLLREAIAAELVGAEAKEQSRAGDEGEGARVVRISELARLNAGLDVVLSQSIEQFVEERDRRSSRAAAKSETRYRALFDSIDEGFCVIEVLFDGEHAVDYRFIEVNAAFERNTGLAHSEGRRIREMIPNQALHWSERYGRIAKSRVAERFEGVEETLGRVFDLYAFPVGEPEQHQVAVLFKDISERKRAEAALRSSQELNAFLLKLSDALRPLSDEVEIHATVTRTARQHLAADRCYYAELSDGSAVIRQDDAREGLISVKGEYPLAGSPLFKAAIEAGRPFVVSDAQTSSVFDATLRQACVEREILSLLLVPVIKDGKPVGLLNFTQSTPRKWTDSEIVLAEETAERAWAAVEHAHALAALKLANERLVEADQRKNDFLAVLSHELRNPLAPIRNSVHVLSRAEPGGEQATRARQVIDRQAQHMVQLIDDLLDVTRITRGKVVLRRERVDLNAIATGTGEDHREMFARGGVALEIVDAGKPLWVDGDRTRLVQVIGNLLTNSSKFTPRGGKTVLTIGERDGRAFIRVRDNGSGMSKETQAHLFEPFVQAAQTLDRAHGGLGLGLALVKGLMDLHHGTVEAHSEGEGKGAEFVVSLPLEVVSDSSVTTRNGQANGKHQNVLVVEDNVDSADSLRDMLMLEGHEVSVAYTGPDGLKAARAQQPDVILCDLGLPGIDGFEVARSIRADAKLRDTYLVALSGYALPEDVTKSKEAGFDRHLAKPPSVEALERVLARG